MQTLTLGNTAPPLLAALLVATVLPSSRALPLEAGLDERPVPPVELDADEARLVGRWVRGTEVGREVFVFRHDRTAISWFEPRGDDHGVRTFVHWEILPTAGDEDADLFFAERIHDGLTNLIDPTWAPEAALRLHRDQLVRGDGAQFEREPAALAHH